MPLLQSAVQLARRVVPRGWAPLLRMAARANPRLRAYPALLSNGDRMTLDLSQTMCLGYFFDGGVPHNQGLSRVMERVLEPGAVYVDVGANIGYFARIGSRLVGPAGRVHAFEPLPSALPLLRANAAAYDNVTVHPVAVGAAEGEIDFYVQAMGDTSSADPDPAAERIRVPVATLDTALAGTPRLDLLKIDVEGYELEVLQGARELIRTHLPLVYFEFLVHYNQGRGLSLADYKALLEPLGYAFYWTNHGPGAAAVTAPQSSDVVAIPPRWMDRVQPA
jgi:FkbM family methyltransferase